MNQIIEETGSVKVFKVGRNEFKTKAEAERCLERQTLMQWKSSIEDALVFDVHEDHKKLLMRSYWDWDDCEYGAPCMDPKRPYGNSDVGGDIAGILEMKLMTDGYGEKVISDIQSKMCRGRHLEMQHYLQILARFGEIPDGRYSRPNTWSEWVKVKP